MLGILLLYYIGSAYSKLAKLHDENKWGYIILGIVAYYAGTFFGGIILASCFLYFSESDFDSSAEMMLTFLSVPIGLFICYGVYKLLELRNEKKDVNNSDYDILDDNLFQ